MKKKKKKKIQKKILKKKVMKKKTARKHKKVQKKHKKFKRAKRVKVTKEQIDEILKKGEERGFVTTSEILYFIPNIENNVDELERIYDVLKERGVELREVREFLEVKSKKETLENNATNHQELIQENTEIRLLAEQLSNQILQEKSKNEQLVELLMDLSNPDLKKIMNKLKI